MDISVVKARLAAAAATVDTVDPVGKLTCYGYTPDDPEIPCFYAGETTFQHNITFAGDVDRVEITCRVLTSTNEDLAGQRLLDRYLRRTGGTSVRAALLAARGAPGQLALDGACSDFNIERIQGYRLYRIGEGRTLFGAEIVVMAIGGSEGEA